MTQFEFAWQAIHSNASPSAFFDALDRFARDWHESRLPRSMRDRAISGVKVSRLGPTGFQIKARGLELRFGASLGTSCEGDVLPEKGGSLIRYHVSLGTPVDLTPEFSEIIARVVEHAESELRAT